MNGQQLDSGTSTTVSTDPNALVYCTANCTIPPGVIF
jgi:hypothetical protein